MELRLPIFYRPFNSGGKGGQHSNKTLNAMECSVRMPCGTLIKASATRSKHQHMNKKAAEQDLAKKVREFLKKDKVRGTNNEVIRTYHKVRNEVIDHKSRHRISYEQAVKKDGFASLVDARRKVMEIETD